MSRWATWAIDGASLYLVDMPGRARPRAAVRAYDPEDAQARALKLFGSTSGAAIGRLWTPTLPSQSALAPGVAYDLDGTPWGLARDEPFGGMAAEFRRWVGEV